LLNYFELRCLKCNYSGIKHVSNYQWYFFTSTNVRSLVETQNGRYDTYRGQILSTQPLFFLPDWLDYYEVNKGWNTCSTDLGKMALQRIFRHAYWKRLLHSFSHFWENNISMNIINYTAEL
jgi:hypothetical protein